MLFGRRPTADPDTLPHAESTETIVGAEAFGWLVDAIRQCVEADRSTTPSPLDSAVQIWVALHGFATLRASGNASPGPTPTPWSMRSSAASSTSSAHRLADSRPEWAAAGRSPESASWTL